ncbi:MAG TPA: cytochrome d ubiquinol oxidase subunit II [Candidatus Binatia bacterium]|nr:cytochrome d ubiquinol oxidase subunit II [Candidatus Binatia bacterium]
MSHLWNLPTLWLALIGLLWMGYVFFEGFDFGVGILLPVLGRDDVDRRFLLRSVWPVWDGNEVWLLVAGGATFAAFPGWYMAISRGFTLPLVLLALALAGRAIAFQGRVRARDPRWARRWDRVIFLASLAPAVVLGVAFANLVGGVPMNAQHQFTGTFLDLLRPFAILGGLTTFALFTYQGALFLALQRDRVVQLRARRIGSRTWWVAMTLLLMFVGWHLVDEGERLRGAATLPLLAPAALAAAGWLHRARRDLAAFLVGVLPVLLLFGALLADLYPRVLVSSTTPAGSLTIFNANAAPQVLTAMTILAAVFTPVAVLYQGWTYLVFRSRLQPADVEGA